MRVRDLPGFATVFWSWDTTEAARIGIMNDLYVVADARGSGLAECLIAECLARCRARGAVRLEWQTAPENLRAQAVYDRVGGVREPWIPFTLASRSDSRTPSAVQGGGAHPHLEPLSRALAAARPRFSGWSSSRL